LPAHLRGHGPPHVSHAGARRDGAAPHGGHVHALRPDRAPQAAQRRPRGGLLMSAPPLLAIEAPDHHLRTVALRKQILFDVSLVVQPGEIVLLTGPSGSGKTTLLTLIGALRSAQKGSLRVLGQELRDASEAALVSVRRQIGYVFQLHNLLDALTATQNVMLGLAGG